MGTKKAAVSWTPPTLSNQAPIRCFFEIKNMEDKMTVVLQIINGITQWGLIATVWFMVWMFRKVANERPTVVITKTIEKQPDKCRCEKELEDKVKAGMFECDEFEDEDDDFDDEMDSDPDDNLTTIDPQGTEDDPDFSEENQSNLNDTEDAESYAEVLNTKLYKEAESTKQENQNIPEVESYIIGVDTSAQPDVTIKTDTTDGVVTGQTTEQRSE